MTLGVSLDGIDESELLVNEVARNYLAAARNARASQNFKIALEEIGKALFVSLEDASVLGGIQVGRPKAEDALKLTAFGVSANEFLRLQEFLPMIDGIWTGEEHEEPKDAAWKQSGFGHPGNWTDSVVDFCIDTCLSVALSIQNASPIPQAREFSDLYEYRVTAQQDLVEVWEDLVDPDEHFSQMHSSNPNLFRVHRRYLKKGEAVTVSAFTQPLVSEDVSVSGASIKRVQISNDMLSAIVGLRSPRQEFVNLAEVDIMCVPQKWIRGLISLPDIPWEDDPSDF